MDIFHPQPYYNSMARAGSEQPKREATRLDLSVTRAACNADARTIALHDNGSTIWRHAKLLPFLSVTGIDEVEEAVR